MRRSRSIEANFSASQKRHYNWANSVFAFRYFPLHGLANFGTVTNVRWIIPITTLFAFVSTAVGQRQDDKLIERLLRPNVSTVNPAQTKQFGTKSSEAEKELSVKNILLSDNTVVTPAFESSRTPFAARVCGPSFSDRLVEHRSEQTISCKGIRYG